jgi:threonine/homoserine/homoserine lactone efflux protein
VSIAFLVTSIVVVVSPGTGVLYTLAAALSRGTRASLIAAVGCTIGIVPQMLAAIFGLAALMNASAAAFQVLKYAGVAYLVYLAWSALRERGAPSVERDAGTGSAAKIIITAVLINLLNPKLTLFFFAFLPQFVSPHEANAVAHMLLLSLVFMAETMVVFVAYGLLAGQARRQIVSRPRAMTWLRRAFAASFVTLAAKLALAER